MDIRKFKIISGLLLMGLFMTEGTVNGTTKDLSQLQNELRNASMFVRHNAAEELTKIGGSQVEKIFTQLVSRGGVENKRLGLIGLATIAPEKSVAHFSRHLEDPSNEVRWAAVYGLGKSGDPIWLKSLKEITKNDPFYLKVQDRYPVRQAAKQALRQIKESPLWMLSYEKAHQLALQEKKPLILFWTIPSEPWSVKMLEKSFFHPKFAQLKKKFIWAKLNVLENSELADQKGVMEVPMVQWVREDGVECERWTGFYSAQTLATDLSAFAKGAPTSEDLRQKIKRDPRDFDSMWLLSGRYLRSNRFQEAAPLLEKIVSSESSVDKMKRAKGLFTLGYTFGTWGKHSKAIKYLSQFVSEFPENKESEKAQYCLALSWLGLGKVYRCRSILNALSKQPLEPSLAKAVNHTLRDIKLDRSK